MKRLIVLTCAGLLTIACEGQLRKSGWFLGGEDRRLSERPDQSWPTKRVDTRDDAPPAPKKPTADAKVDWGFGDRRETGTDRTETVEVPGTGVLINPEPPTARAGQRTGGPTVTLNFVDADVRDVIKTVLGGTLGLNFAVDPKVKGAITLQTSRPIARRDVLPTLEAVLRQSGIVVVRSGSIYNVAPAANAARRSGVPEIAGLTSGRGSGFGVEIVPLSFAGAAEMAKIIGPLAPAGAVVRTDTVRNMLIVSGTREERETIGDIVSIFDVDWLSGMSFALVALEFAQPAEAITDLERVFGAANGGPLEGALKFFPVERRNSILVISPQPEYLEQAKSWIARLDVGGADQERLYVYPVQNARATDLAAILGQVFSDSPVSTPSPAGTTLPGQLQNRSTGPSSSSLRSSGDRNTSSTESARTIGPPLSAAQATPSPAAPSPVPGAPASPVARSTSPSADALPDELNARIIPDDVNNSLVVMAQPRVWRMIEDALRKLDVVPLQVMIEATIAEVTLNDTLRYGVQSFFNKGSSSFTLSTGATGTLASTFPGFSYVFQQTGTDIQIVLDALDSITDVRVISSPQVLVLDNRTAELQVGDQVPISTQQSVSNTDSTAPTVNQIEFRDTGVVLRVTPRVNASGVVNLEIQQEESSAIATTSSGIDSPTIQQRRLQSSVVVNSGETIALGGLIRETLTDAVSGIPLLSSIPVLGNLFGSTSETARRTELLVLITPRVIRNQEEARAVTRDLRETLRNASAIYGAGPSDR